MYVWGIKVLYLIKKEDVSVSARVYNKPTNEASNSGDRTTPGQGQRMAGQAEDRDGVNEGTKWRVW